MAWSHEKGLGGAQKHSLIPNKKHMESKHPEQQYLDLLQDVLDNGIKQEDKGTGAITHSVFGRQIRFDLAQGFPLLTTKKVFWKGVLQELYWFLSGQSNIKYLVDNGVHIWDDYPYKIYVEKRKKDAALPDLTKDEFVRKIADVPRLLPQHRVWLQT